MDILEKLFGNATRGKTMRAFIYNEGNIWDLKSISKQTKSSASAVKKELNLLQKINLIKKKSIRDKKGKKIAGYALNQNFKHLEALRNFLLQISPLSEDVIAKKLQERGRAKLVVVSGMFLNTNESRADMLVVSEKSNEKKIDKIIAEIGSEFGRDISYALFSKDDFVYRKSMGDKLIRDIFDFPHKIILDRIGISK
jgi:predicted transcriptional regulator